MAACVWLRVSASGTRFVCGDAEALPALVEWAEQCGVGVELIDASARVLRCDPR